MTYTPKMQQIYRVTQFGTPVEHPNPRIGEREFAHADMLRYDLAFCSPKDPSLVIFPKFKQSGAGTIGGKITWARWESFILAVRPYEDETIYDFSDWITCRRTPDGEFNRMTLDQYMRTMKAKLI